MSAFEKAHKAGFPPVLTFIIVLLSTPGFYQFFFDNTDDVAKAKALIAKEKAEETKKKIEIAYEVLKTEVENLRDDDQNLRREIDFLIRELDDVRAFSRMEHARLRGGRVSASSTPPEVEEKPVRSKPKPKSSKKLGSLDSLL